MARQYLPTLENYLAGPFRGVERSPMANIKNRQAQPIDSRTGLPVPQTPASQAAQDFFSQLGPVTPLPRPIAGQPFPTGEVRPENVLNPQAGQAIGGLLGATVAAPSRPTIAATAVGSQLGDAFPQTFSQLGVQPTEGLGQPSPEAIAAGQAAGNLASGQPSPEAIAAGQAAGNLASGQIPIPEAIAAGQAAAGQVFPQQPSPEAIAAGQAAAGQVFPQQPSPEAIAAGQAAGNLASGQIPIPEITDNSFPFSQTPQSTSTIDINETLGRQFRNLGNKPPGERAHLGAVLGGTLGMATDGVAGGLMGAGVGALASRALGEVQNGETLLRKDRERARQVLNTLKIATPEGKIQFEDGGEFTLNDDVRLPNVSIAPGAQADRAPFELDPTSPFVNRTTAVSRPLARFLVQGLLGRTNTSSTQDKQLLDQVTGYLTNAFSNGVDNIDTVYERAREFAKKAGISEQALRQFLEANKSTIDSENEARSMLNGINRLFTNS